MTYLISYYCIVTILNKLLIMITLTLKSIPRNIIYISYLISISCLIYYLEKSVNDGDTYIEK